MLDFVAANHATIAYSVGVFLATLNMAIKLALYFHPLADWVTIAEKRPRVAALVRLLDAVGISPVTVLQAVIDLIRGEASKGAVASAKALQVSASKPLISPPVNQPKDNQ